MGKLIVKQLKSSIGTKPMQRKTLVALGLHKVNSERIHEDNAVIRGMINKVIHLISVTDQK